MKGRRRGTSSPFSSFLILSLSIFFTLPLFLPQLHPPYNPSYLTFSLSVTLPSSLSLLLNPQYSCHPIHPSDLLHHLSLSLFHSPHYSASIHPPGPPQHKHHYALENPFSSRRHHSFLFFLYLEVLHQLGDSLRLPGDSARRGRLHIPHQGNAKGGSGLLWTREDSYDTLCPRYVFS